MKYHWIFHAKINEILYFYQVSTIEYFFFLFFSKIYICIDIFQLMIMINVKILGILR